MAATTDKARFYLEQTVPELREWERQEIFSPDEITSIAGKRSDFEHLLNARGSTPSDYARYAEYEMNLDTLRRKRVKRKGVKAPAHTGQRRVFSILDRATRKFHGDVGLWMQYLEYAKKQKANKKLARILTDVLRMHPTKPGLWIYAARYAADVQADIGTARSYMQRGLRLCKTSRDVYLEYARIEMAYLAKLAARRKILGLDPSATQDIEVAAQDEDLDSDKITLPALVAEESDTDLPGRELTHQSVSKATAESPLMSGAIPVAIYDAAMKEFSHDSVLGERFFDMFSEFPLVPCVSTVLQRVIDDMLSAPKAFHAALTCQCKKVLVGVSPTSPAFPAALRGVLAQIKSSIALADEEHRPMLAKSLRDWLKTLSQSEELGNDLRKVLAATIRRLDSDAYVAGGS